MLWGYHDVTVVGTVILWGVFISCCIVTAFRDSSVFEGQRALSPIAEEYADFDVYSSEEQGLGASGRGSEGKKNCPRQATTNARRKERGEDE